jgi:glycosyltransferase involved in cell wall biosynthesis
MTEKKPKLIFFITKAFWGGAQKYVFDLATSKKYRENFDVVVVVGGGGELVEKLEACGVRVLQAKYLKNSLNPITLFLSVLENVKIILQEKPKLIHNNSSFSGISIGCASFVTGTKSIFTIHGWTFNEDRSKVQKNILKLAFWFILFFHKKTISVSKKIYEQTPNFLNMKKKSKIIYNGVDEPIFETLNLVEVNAKVKLVTVAEINKNKNHQLILSALSLLPENLQQTWEYYIIGDGEEKENLVAKINSHIYKDNIKYLGKVNDASKYLQNFDIFLLSSITEALGYVLIEAGFAKLATVATNVGGIPEIIINNENGYLIDNFDATVFAEKIKLLIENTEKRKELGANLYKKVSTNFTKEKMINETYDFTRLLC